MIYEKIKFDKADENAYLEVFAAEKVGDYVRSAMLVIPGGGYASVCSDREGEPIALAFMPYGYNCFVLHYTVKKEPFPSHLIQASKAIKYIKDNAERYNIDPDKVFAVGFSAGGHLAATVGTLWHGKESEKYFGDTEKVKPNGLILSYPVISGGEYAHRGSFNNLLGEGRMNDEKWIDYLSLENRVDEKTPRTFLWHTNGDTAVPCENSLFFALELRKHGVPLELHIFEKGPHGIATANTLTNERDFALRTQSWLEMSADWVLEQ